MHNYLVIPYWVHLVHCNMIAFNEDTEMTVHPFINCLQMELTDLN